MSLFREHRIYKDTEGHSVLYICLEDLQSGRFAVQQAEFFDTDDTTIRAGQIASLTLELFAERSREAATWHDSLIVAIAAHNAEFEGFFQDARTAG